MRRRMVDAEQIRNWLQGRQQRFVRSDRRPAVSATVAERLIERGIIKRTKRATSGERN